MRLIWRRPVTGTVLQLAKVMATSDAIAIIRSFIIESIDCSMLPYSTDEVYFRINYFTLRPVNRNRDPKEPIWV